MCGTRIILLSTSLFAALSVTGQQNRNERKSAPKPPSAAAGQETFLKYCASCHVTPDELVPVELYAIQELNYLIGNFFDQALYHLVRGYEAAAVAHFALV